MKRRSNTVYHGDMVEFGYERYKTGICIWDKVSSVGDIECGFREFASCDSYRCLGLARTAQLGDVIFA